MLEEIVRFARIVIVDDEEANAKLLTAILIEDGYMNLTIVEDPHALFPLVAAASPDLILLDLHMPGMDGFAVLARLQLMLPRHIYVPIVVLTADDCRSTKHRALSMGAADFISKPFDRLEVLLRVKNLLKIQDHNRSLGMLVEERTREFERAQAEILTRLALAAEYRDDNTGQHTQRVGHIAAGIAQALGSSDAEVQLIRQAAPLHDIGKIGIADSILLKPGRLTDDEYTQMKTHTSIGAGILGGSGFAQLQLAYQIASTHQERWDGSGYPNGLRGEQIPRVGRIVAVADVFDALTHERPYKHAWTEEDAFQEIKRQRGKQFDPSVVDAFLYMMGVGSPPHSGA
jgi:putative two-component system response regulator